MDGICCLTQGSLTQQQANTEVILKCIKEMYPSLANGIKDYTSLKKATLGDGNWAQIKEILRGIINTKDGTLSLSPKRFKDLITILFIPPTQRRMSIKKLEQIIGKLHSMHLAIPGAIGYFYHIQMALTKANHRKAYLSNSFHHDISYWQHLCCIISI